LFNILVDQTSIIKNNLDPHPQPAVPMMRTALSQLPTCSRVVLRSPGALLSTFPSALKGGLAANLKDPTLLRTSTFVAGEWRERTSAGTYDVTDPANGELLATMAACGPAEVEESVAAADAAQKRWAHKTGKERGIVLHAWFDLMVANGEDLAKILTSEAGKPLGEARAEVGYAASFFEWFGEEAKRTYGSVIPETVPGRRLLATKEPVGTCALITPWNFPAAMITRKVGPCLAAGCSAVIKPAEDTPLSALALMVLAERAGVPKGLVSVLPVPRSGARAVGEQLCKHDKVRKVSFTGSTGVGVQLQQWCAEGMKRTSLELGGNAPFIVFDDAHIDTAVNALMAAKVRATNVLGAVHAQSIAKSLEPLEPLEPILRRGCCAHLFAG